MTIRQACLSLPAAGLRGGTLGMTPWRSLRMCTSMAQEQVSAQHSYLAWQGCSRQTAFLTGHGMPLLDGPMSECLARGYTIHLFKDHL